MKKSQMKFFLTAGVIMLFLISSISSEVTGFKQTTRPESPIKKNTPTNNEVMISCITGGIPTKKQISLESCQQLQQLFSTLIEANAHNPCSENTRMLKVRFIEMLADLGLITHDLSVEKVCSLIEPPWSHSTLLKQISHLMPPRSLDDDNATLLFCSMAGAGWGFVIPPFMLPRPRLAMQWRGFYPDSSAVSVAEMATGRGVIARGTQVGTALGFIGIGFAFAFPGAPAQFGFLGYSLITKLQGADMTWYYANFPPLIMEISPEDGAVEVPVSLSELQFTLKDYDWDKMTYNVITSPDIGSGADANVGNGAYNIPLSGLESGTTYTWTVTVTDGTDTVENAFTFTTEAVAPMISNPIPINEEKDVPMDITQLQFTLKDPQGDTMDYTVETSPNIGYKHETGVHDGAYTVPVSGMTYGATYHWYVNVTDGAHWTRKIFSFETGYPSQFDPFDYGWQYRKQITIDHTMIPDDLTHFPVLISTTDTDLSQKAQTDGGDIMFMNDSGVTTRLYHDLESYDASSGSLIAWVDSPSLSSSTDTVFYMYYGNPDCINQAYPEKTWGSSYEAVWHMNDATPSTILDSTANQYTGIKIALNEPSEENGRVGKSQNFDGIDDYIGISSSVIGTGMKTASAWIYVKTNTYWQEIFTNSAGPSSNDKGTEWNIEEGGTTIQMLLGNGGTTGHFLKVNVNIPDHSNWHYYTMVYNGTDLRGYIDGVFIAIDNTMSGSESEPDYNMRMGTTNHGPSYALNASLDELRISNVPRSPTWILTEYANQNSPASFLNIGPEIPGL
jgi:hypothetical protein